MKAFDYVDKNLETFIEDLKKLCSIPSISAQNTGIGEAAVKVRDMFEKAGLKAEIFKVDNGNPLVYGEYKPKSYDRTILFYNHYDVQPPDPLELWECPPFNPTIRDGKIFARGVADNKGNIVARIKAVESILNTLGDLPLAVKFVVEGEEEIGSPHLPEYVERYKNIFSADMGVWESGYRHETERPTIKLGVRGIAFFEFTVRGANRDLHSSQAGIIPNPAWRLVKFLGSLRDEDGRILVNGFYDDIKPMDKEDEDLLKAIPFDDEDLKRKFTIKKFVGDFKGFEALKSLYFKPTCNINGIISGYTGSGSKTIIPNKASAKVEFRLLPGQKPKRVLKRLKEHTKKHDFTDVEVRLLYGYEAARTSPSSIASKIVREATKKTYGLEPIIYPISAGSSPMYLFAELNIPIVSVGVGYSDSCEHSPNENIRIEDFRLGIKNIITIVDMLSGL